LIADVRGDPGSVHNLKDAIAGNVEASGLQADCPLREGLEMNAEEAAAVEDEVCSPVRLVIFACCLLWLAVVVAVAWKGLAGVRVAVQTAR
jgi:hypothetical protein